MPYQQTMLQTWITVLVPAISAVLVTILGLVINYFKITGSFKKELSNKKSNIALESLLHGPETFFELFKLMLKQTKEPTLEQAKLIINKLEELEYTVFVYGSAECIKIFSNIKEQIFEENSSIKNGSSVDPDNGFKMMAYFTLLICQMKFDLTGEKCSTKYWYKSQIEDYKSYEDKYKEITNQIIKDLRLKRFLKIKNGKFNI